MSLQVEAAQSETAQLRAQVSQLQWKLGQSKLLFDAVRGQDIAQVGGKLCVACSSLWIPSGLGAWLKMPRPVTCPPLQPHPQLLMGEVAVPYHLVRSCTLCVHSAVVPLGEGMPP